jgi:rubrerythrin
METCAGARAPSRMNQEGFAAASDERREEKSGAPRRRCISLSSHQPVRPDPRACTRHLAAPTESNAAPDGVIILVRPDFLERSFLRLDKTKETTVNPSQLNELLLQSVEHEKGGVEVYELALKCVVNSDLKEEWEKYLEETRHHVRVLTEACKTLGVSTDQNTPGQQVVRHLGASLVQAMKMALKAGTPEAAQLVACECVVLAETKDHLDWELIGKCAEKLKGEEAKTLTAAYEEIEDQEDEHLYHSKGWRRELWIESLGMKALLPPPEERKHVKTAIGAARAEQASEKGR